MTGKYILIVLLAATALVPASAAEPGNDFAAGPGQPAGQYGRVPPHFIRNDGQLPAEVRYYLKGSRGTVYLSETEVVFDFISHRPEPPARLEPSGEDLPDGDDKVPQLSRLVFRLRFAEPNPDTVIEGAKQLPGKINYFIGDRENWRSSIPTYQEVVYRGLYPGIDLAFRLKEDNILYHYTVAPGADPGRIAFSYSGVERLEINPSGELIVHTPFGGFRTPAPRIHQEIGGRTAEVDGAFVLKDDSTVALEIGPYDRKVPLVIEM